MTSEVEWRRRWKPDFLSQTWKPVEMDGEQFLLKLHLDDGYHFLVASSTEIWSEDLSIEAVKNRTTKLNPSVEAPVTKILDLIRDSLEAGTSKKDVKLSVAYMKLADSDSEKIMLSLQTKLAGLPFVWKFNCSPAKSSSISEHLTVPLLAMVGELSRRQQELFALLRRKDKEIDDLRAQGVKVSRKHIETGVFDDTAFSHSMSVSKNFDQQIQNPAKHAFMSGSQQLYQDIMMKQAYCNRVRTEDGEEADTFDEDVAAPSTISGGTSAPSWANRLPPSLAVGSVSQNKSPTKSPGKSPTKDVTSPTKDTELIRRQALEKRMVDEEDRKEQKKKKKKKINF